MSTSSVNKPAVNRPVEVSTPSDSLIVVKRDFAARRDLVWDSHTKPELMKRWCFGPDGWSMSVCEIDLRVGGKYRYVWRNLESGHEFGSQGEFREVTPTTRLVTTERMDGFECEALNTLELAETSGRTMLTCTMLFPSREVRDQALKSGMSDGMAMGYDRLEATVLGSNSAS